MSYTQQATSLLDLTDHDVAGNLNTALDTRDAVKLESMTYLLGAKDDDDDVWVVDSSGIVPDDLSPPMSHALLQRSSSSTGVSNSADLNESVIPTFQLFHQFQGIPSSVRSSDEARMMYQYINIDISNPQEQLAPSSSVYDIGPLFLASEAQIWDTTSISVLSDGEHQFMRDVDLLYCNPGQIMLHTS